MQYEEVCGPIGADFYCGDHDPAYLAKPYAGMQFPDYPSMWANGQVVNAIKRVRRLYLAIPFSFLACPESVLANHSFS